MPDGASELLVAWSAIDNPHWQLQLALMYGLQSRFHVVSPVNLYQRMFELWRLSTCVCAL